MVFFFCLFIIAWEGKVFNQEDGRALLFRVSRDMLDHTDSSRTALFSCHITIIYLYGFSCRYFLSIFICISLSTSDRYPTNTFPHKVTIIIYDKIKAICYLLC